MKIGIHTGVVISGVVGETKPQFSLIGDTVTKAQKICKLSDALKVSSSKETIRYLELYTNNLNFQETNQKISENSDDHIFTISISRGKYNRNGGFIDKYKSFGPNKA